jgi:hypothetical protein
VSNSVQVIFPYKVRGIWMFDDAAVGVAREPFVGTINTFIDKATEKIPAAESGVALLFSAAAFPGHTISLTWSRGELGGNWYKCKEANDEEGWLCPTLLSYFETAPRELYVKAEPRQPESA